MPGFFETLFGGGSAPTFDPSQAYGAINQYIEKGAQALQQPQYNMIGSPYDQALLSILQGGGPQGLNPMLQPAYNYGMQQIGQQQNQQSAAAQTAAAARGLTGSSIEQSGMNAAAYNAQQAQAQLLSTLLGQQYGTQAQAAGALAGQGGQVSMQQQAIQQELARLYQGAGQDIANVGMFTQEQNLAAQLAQQQQQSQLWGSLIGLGGTLGGSYMLGKYLGGAGTGAGAGAGTLGGAATPFGAGSLNLPGGSISSYYNQPIPQPSLGTW